MARRARHPASTSSTRPVLRGASSRCVLRWLRSEFLVGARRNVRLHFELSRHLVQTWARHALVPARREGAGMPRFSPRIVIAAGLAGTMAIAVPMALGATTSNAQPANKAVASGSSTTPISSADSGLGTTLLTATIKTSKPEDLLLTASVECTILTDITTDNNDPMSKAAAGIRVWIEIDGKTVPIEDTSAPPQ